MGIKLISFLVTKLIAKLVAPCMWTEPKPELTYYPLGNKIFPPNQLSSKVWRMQTCFVQILTTTAICAYPRSRCLHATVASRRVQGSAQITPHRPPIRTSSRPSLGFRPPDTRILYAWKYVIVWTKRNVRSQLVWVWVTIWRHYIVVYFKACKIKVHLLLLMDLPGFE